ncbi:MAG: hypothetical protein GY870_04695 [archaeon]|nr:hypothetical protein [archaeon]
MSNEVCVLLTIIYGNDLIRCALKASKEILTDDCIRYYNEPENKAIFEKLLPSHVKSCGVIAEVQKIFEVVVYEE